MERGDSMSIMQLLHGLACVGVFLLNFIIYETIAILIWFPVAYCLYRSDKVSDAKASYISGRLAIVLLVAFVVALLLMLFGKACIVPLPNFS